MNYAKNDVWRSWRVELPQGCAARFRFRKDKREIEAKIVSVVSEKRGVFAWLASKRKHHKSEAKLMRNEAKQMNKTKNVLENDGGKTYYVHAFLRVLYVRVHLTPLSLSHPIEHNMQVFFKKEYSRRTKL